jgi:hypothetical protein
MGLTVSGFTAALNLRKSWPARRWLDLAWLVALGALLAYGLNLYRSGWLCAYMGTDFRGYYASAQIALERGFPAVYDPQAQAEFQADLRHDCPDPDYPQPMPRVSMPYLPVFVLPFLPLTLLDFTASYLLWVALNLGLLVAYLAYFSKATGAKITGFRLAQWVICIPVISNLFLGQMNLWLVVCLGEFTRYMMRAERVRSGFWLGVMLLKPHTLALLLPGLALSHNWGALLGFLFSLLIILGSSFLLAGLQGLAANALLMIRFAGPLIQTAPAMMNYRALALHLGGGLPAWIAWAIGIAAMGLAALAVLRYWRGGSIGSRERLALLLLATLAGTFAVVWHSHFYLQMCLIPFLLYLDRRRELPPAVFSIWLFGPFILFGAASVLNPEMLRNLFGMGMLALNQFLLAWAAWRLAKLE